MTSLALVMLKTLTESLIQIAYLVILTIQIFNRSTIEGADELDTSYGTFSRLWTTQFFCEDRVISNAQVSKLPIFV